MGLTMGHVLSGYTVLPSAGSLGASPAVIQNPAAYAQDVMVSGGSVSLIEYSRDGVSWYTTGLVGGMMRLSPGDRLRITYLVPPTVTWIPR